MKNDKNNINYKLSIINFFKNLKTRFMSMCMDNTFWTFLGITILFLGIFVKLEYATDTYSIFNQDYMIPLKHFMTSGRFVTAIFWYLISILNLGIYNSYIISFGLGIICITLAIYKLYKIIISDISNKLISEVLSVSIVLNAFLVELFLFFEKGILAFSILMSILAVDCFIKCIKKNEFINLAFSVMFMLLAVFSYQGTISIFAGIGAVYVVKYSKNIKKFFVNNIILAVIYVIPAIVNYSIANCIFSNSRITSR